MDLLFKRYADPFSLLNAYIQTSRFMEFIRTFNDQIEEDIRWDIYLHKVWDKSYTEFCESLQVTQDQQMMSELDMEATVKKSMDILGNFNPLKEEGEV
jgi:hypothetical protein